MITHIHGNLLGMLMFVVGGIIAGVGYLFLKLPDPVTMMAVGITLIAADLVVRFRARPETGWLTNKQLGGYLFFIPAWGFGIIVVVDNIISGLQPS